MPAIVNRSLGFLIAFFFLNTGTNGQIRLALTGGIHSANITEKNDIPGWDTSQKKYYGSKTGFQLGVLAEIPLGTRGLYFQPGINYSSKGRKYVKYYDSSNSQTDTIYNQFSINLAYVEIPLYITYKLPLSKDRKNSFYLSAGPYIAFIYSASQSYQNRILNNISNHYDYNSGNNDLEVGNAQNKYKTFDAGINARAGFELGNVMIGGYYSHGFSNNYTAEYKGTFHHELIGASLGIWLAKSKPSLKVRKDSDKDGTPDEVDACPAIAGSPKYNGCPVPDTDHDGIDDDHDSCKTVPGILRYNGCPIPDADGDGVNDEEDSCKTVAGVAKYHGCPIPDADGDGVNDDEDSCKTVAGPAGNNGCPVQVKEELIVKAKYAAQNVTFQLASTRLTAGSFAALEELADTLKANPELHLTISGYTDNTGNPKYNLKLSRLRAGVVRKTLMQDGVPGGRISAVGYGDGQPIDSNSSKEGRARNRRVEFKLDAAGR